MIIIIENQECYMLGLRLLLYGFVYVITLLRRAVGLM